MALRGPQHLGQTDEDGHRRPLELEIVLIVARAKKQRDALVAPRMPHSAAPYSPVGP